jgi:hypothetical protein
MKAAVPDPNGSALKLVAGPGSSTAAKIITIKLQNFKKRSL